MSNIGSTAESMQGNISQESEHIHGDSASNPIEDDHHSKTDPTEEEEHPETNPTEEEDHSESNPIEEEDLNVNENAEDEFQFDEETAINSEEDLLKVSTTDLNSGEYLVKFHFKDIGVAFMFYNWYGSIKGFSARKCRLMRNSKGEITQQTFVCHKEGHRRQKQSEIELRRGKADTRCGCLAKCRVHVDELSGRWYIKHFNDVHNHTLVLEKWTGMLPGHRKMTDYDKYQMNMMRSVGIKTSNIYGLIAAQTGGYDKVGFMKRDMYNEQWRQKKIQTTDATALLEFLERKATEDDMFYWKHTVNEEGRLERIFWCDGACKRDYSVFGDVLAFDATYKKNKYLCPLVIFSGVNHHNQSIIFGAGIVTDETEETYVWLLQKLLEAMGGKSPVSIITDGDKQMKKAIGQDYPNSHHRLCAWHLLRNAVSNIKDPKFVSKLKPCMLGDCDVDEFERRWNKFVADFGLQENEWVLELYERKSMWATAHIRGKFFAGFRTTSRCESLHYEFGKYVGVQNNLLEFVQNFFRWLNYMRYREVEAYFLSQHGEPKLKTQFKCLERSAAKLYTREIFNLFVPTLQKVYLCRIVGFYKSQDGDFIYTVLKADKDGYEWYVSFSPITLEFQCSCLRLESLGIPCEHMLYIIWYLDIANLPDCVVKDRWTKSAKDSIPLGNMSNSGSIDPTILSQYKGMVDRCHKMAIAALQCGRPDLIRRTTDLVTIHTQRLEAAERGEEVIVNSFDPYHGGVQNPQGVRPRGSGARQSSAPRTTTRTPRKPPTCSVCGRKGHNKSSCIVLHESRNRGSDGNYTDVFEDSDYANVDTNI